MAFWSPSSITPINQGAEPGNLGDGDTIRNAFTYVENNFTAISQQLGSVNPDYLNANISNVLRATTANVGNILANNILTSITVYGNLNVAANIVPTENGMYDLGSPSNRFRTVYSQFTDAATQIQSSSDAGLLIVHANASIGDVQDVGIFGNVSHSYVSNTYAFFGFQTATDNFTYKITTTNATLGNSVVYDGVYGNVHFGSAFLSNTTPATSNVTGALVVAGGISSNNNIYAQGNIFSRGFRVLNTSDVSGLGYPVYNGSGSMFAGNTLFTTTTPSTSTNTGAVVVLGGVGVFGNIVAGGYLGNFWGNITNPLQTGITTVGSLGNLTVVGTTSTNTLQATSVGATSILSSSITTSTLQAATINTTNQLVASTINAGTIGNIGANIVGSTMTIGRITGSNNLDITGGNVTVSTDNTATGFVSSAGLTNAIFAASKSVNSFLQVSARNPNSGASVSTDFIAYANNGTNSRGFIDMGIAGNGFADPAYGITKAGDGYIFVSAPAFGNAVATGGNLVLATADGSFGDIVFAAGGFVSGTEQGRFKTDDGLYLTGNLVATTGTIYQGEGAKLLEVDDYFFPGYVGLTNASGIFVGNDDAFVQFALRNHSAGTSASTDMIVYSSNGDNDSGWMDMGITSENFADATYGVTGPADGYLFMSAPVGTTGNGSIYISTSGNGAHNDIVFSTDGFTKGNERMRIVGTDRPGDPAGVEVYIGTESTSVDTGALRVRGGMGIRGNLNVAGNVSIVGNLTFGGAGTTTSTSTLVIENPITFLANSNPANLQDIGMSGQYVVSGTTYHSGLTRNASTGQWRFYDRATIKPTTTVNYTGSVYAGVVVGSANVANTTPSTSTTSGALTVAGGVGVGGSMFIGGNIIPSGNLSTNLGSATNWWNTIYGVSTQAKYADLAERYVADAEYEPGTVVVFGGTAEITVTGEFADTRVAGAVSTDPAYLMNSECPGLAVALRGRVPCKVIGPVQKGDLLVTSATPGYAQSVGNDRLYSLSVFAKSLVTDLSGGEKVIEAVII